MWEKQHREHKEESILKDATPIGNTLATVKPIVRDVNASSWRELASSAGRKYYFNTVTKMTTYEMPSEYRSYLDSRGRAASEGRLSKEQCEEVFFNVLRERCVRSDWSWEEALRAVIDHAEYKIIPTLLERKAAFQHFQTIQAEAEREERKLQAEGRRARFKELLARSENLPTNWQEACNTLKDDPDFIAVETGRERIALFDEFVEERRRTEAEKKRTQRRVAGIKLMRLLPRIPEVGLSTRWRDLPAILNANAAFKGDPDMQAMTPPDLLATWEEYLLEAQKHEDLERQAERDAERAHHRSNRASFLALLKALQQQDKFTALSDWQAVYKSHLKGHPAFQALAMQLHGSGPLDIFWDLLDRMQTDYTADKQSIVQHIGTVPMEKMRSLEHFSDALRGIKLVNTQHVALAYAELIVSKKRAIEDSEAPPVKRRYSDPDVLRRLVDAYKAFLASSSIITPSATWHASRPLLAQQRPFVELEDEDRRKYYFEKAVKKARMWAGDSIGSSPLATAGGVIEGMGRGERQGTLQVEDEREEGEV